MSTCSTLSLSRRLLRELKRADPNSSGGGAVWRYATSEIRKRRSASEEVVRTQQQLMETYVSYLESSRLHRELLSQFQGRGERSVEESAKLVGLKLPEQR